MKKIALLIGVLMLVAQTSFARDLSGAIRLDDGQTVIRINVGGEEDRTSRSMVRRINRLEQAVRELQNRVYRLEDRHVPTVTVWTCKLVTNGPFSKTYFSKPFSTKGEAQRSAYRKCLQAEAFQSKCSERESSTMCTKEIKTRY